MIARPKRERGDECEYWVNGERSVRRNVMHATRLSWRILTCPSAQRGMEPERVEQDDGEDAAIKDERAEPQYPVFSVVRRPVW